jgi:hypothetical protein
VPLAVGELSYNGLTLSGAGTGKWRVAMIEGLSGPDARLEEATKALANGAWTYGLLSGARHVILTGFCVSTPSAVWADMLGTWETTFANRADDLPLATNFDGTTRTINCKPVNRHWIVDDLFGRGTARWAVELVAGDPTIY